MDAEIFGGGQTEAKPRETHALTQAARIVGLVLTEVPTAANATRGLCIAGGEGADSGTQQQTPSTQAANRCRYARKHLARSSTIPCSPLSVNLPHLLDNGPHRPLRLFSTSRQHRQLTLALVTLPLALSCTQTAIRNITQQSTPRDYWTNQPFDEAHPALIPNTHITHAHTYLQ